MITPSKIEWTNVTFPKDAEIFFKKYYYMGASQVSDKITLQDHVIPDLIGNPETHFSIIHRFLDSQSSWE